MTKSHIDRLDIELHRNDWETLREVLWSRVRTLRRGQPARDKMSEPLEIAIGKLLAGNPGDRLTMDLRPSTCDAARKMLIEDSRHGAAARLAIAKRDADE